MGRKLMELDEARRIVIESCTPLSSEPVPLESAFGRVLGEDVRSDVAIPPFDNSAMDGYAVRAADTAAVGRRATMRVVGEAQAGRPAGRALQVGEAIRISTGAVVPVGADAILRQEDARQRNAKVETEVRLEPGRDIRRAGEDIEPGDTVLAAGTPLGAAELGVLASIGCDPVPCHRRPRLTVVGTGDELVDPSAEIEPGLIRDSNGIALSSLATAAGAHVTARRTVGDDRDLTRRVLSEAIRDEITLICGGVSVGPHDHVRAVLAELDVEQLFWGVALRPGRPIWFGLVEGGARQGGGLVFGLPGNPVSAVVTFLLFARAALRVLTGLQPLGNRITATLDQSYEKRPGRTHALRVALSLEEDGWHATLTRPEQGSHILTSMLGADALAMIPADSEGVSAGEAVEIELI
jgi:molybdopterin molybdotransferase